MKATVKTFSENNRCSVVEIEGVGTMTMIGFAQKLYKAGIIDYTTFIKSRRVAFSSEFADKLVNENIKLFI